MIKKPAFTGYVFLCSDATEGECLERLLFGGQNTYLKRVEGVKKGDKLFLYNYQSKKLHGVFDAVSNLKKNIVRQAWRGIYPLQIKVRRLSSPKPLSRDDLRGLIKFDMVGRPSSRLTEEMVADLQKLFISKKRARFYDDSTRYVADDGHKVRSKAEQQIDNWLYKNRIAHGYEVPIPGAKRCDFEIPLADRKIYIEYWGKTDKAYLKNKKSKQKIYKVHKLELIDLTPTNFRRHAEIISKHLS